MKNPFLISIILILFISCKQIDSNANKSEIEQVKEKYQPLIDNQTIYKLLNSEGMQQIKGWKNCKNIINRETMFYIGYDTNLLKKVDTIFLKKIRNLFPNSIEMVFIFSLTKSL